VWVELCLRLLNNSLEKRKRKRKYKTRISRRMA
jgi:hypothetical protein